MQGVNMRWFRRREPRLGFHCFACRVSYSGCTVDEIVALSREHQDHHAAPPTVVTGSITLNGELTPETGDAVIRHLRRVIRTNGGGDIKRALG